MIEQIKNFVHEYPPLISFGLTTVVSIIIYSFRPKVKLIWGTKSDFRHVMRAKEANQQNLVVHSAHYLIHNTGRLPAHNIEIVFNSPVDEISIWQQRKYTFDLNGENRQIVQLPFLSSKEAIDLFVLSIGKDLPVLMNVKCAEAIGKQVPVNYHRQFPKWVYFGLWSLIFLGIVFVVERMVQFVFGTLL